MTQAPRTRLKAAGPLVVSTRRTTTPKLIRCQNRALRCNWAMHRIPPLPAVVVCVLIFLSPEAARAQTGAAAVGAFDGPTHRGAPRRPRSGGSRAAPRSECGARGGGNK